MKTDDYAESYLDIKLAINMFYKFCLLRDQEAAIKALDAATQYIEQTKEILKAKPL
jgi:hypothetical protein